LTTGPEAARCTVPLGSARRLPVSRRAGSAGRAVTIDRDARPATTRGRGDSSTGNAGGSGDGSAADRNTIGASAPGAAAGGGAGRRKSRSTPTGALSLTA
jgi:hypothetical protein